MDSTTILASQVTLGAVSSFLLEKLKNAKWFPVLQQDSAKVVKVVFAAVTSLCAVTGLSYTYDPVAHTLLIANLSLSAIMAASWHWLTQFVIQEGWYQVAVQKKP